MVMVLPPIRDSFCRSANEATPVMSDASTSGTAIRRSRRRKMVPNGVIQSPVNPLQPASAATMP